MHGKLPPTFVITEADPQHYPAIRDLYKQSLKANPKGFVQNLKYHGDIVDLIDRIRATDGSFAVGLEDDRLVAMGGLRPIEGQSAAEICKLHVSADVQGRGYGCAMCKYFVTCARKKNLEKIELHVTTSQDKAISLYQKLGFTKDHVALWESEFEGEKLSFETMHMSRDMTDAPADCGDAWLYCLATKAC